MKLLDELRRRNVLRAAIAYVITAWVVVESSTLLLDIFVAPPWVAQTIVILLIAGFPVAMVFAWMFEITPEGVKHDHEVDPATAAGTGRYIVMLSVVMAMLAAGLFITDRFLIDSSNRSDRGEGPPIIAVLPFEIIGSEGRVDLSDGLHHDLLTRMSKLRAFSVISRTSMLEYRETTKNMRQIGAELGATYILEGGVQVSGDMVRINAQLINAALDEHFWAETYNRDLSATDLFAIQSELAADIAEQLELVLSPADHRYVQEVPTRNTEAYTAYLAGLRILDDPSLPGHERGSLAHRKFEEAVAMDPEFTSALVALIRSSGYWPVVWENYESMLADTTKYLETINRLAPGSYEAGIAEVYYLYYARNDFGAVLPALASLEELGALDASALYMRGKALRRAARLEDAYQSYLAAERLDPRASQVVSDLLSTSLYLGDCNEAGFHAAALLEISPDDADARAQAGDYELNCNLDTVRAAELVRGFEFTSDSALWISRTAAALDHDWDRAIALFELTESHDAWWGDPVQDLVVKAYLLQRQGRDEEADAVLETIGDILDENEDSDAGPWQPAVSMYRLQYSGMCGDAEETRRWASEVARIAEDTRDWDLISRENILRGLVFSYATSGLADEGVSALNEYFSGPHTMSFRFVEAHLAFDIFRDHPGYIALREKYGD
jgi:TolB-like protein